MRREPPNIWQRAWSWIRGESSPGSGLPPAPTEPPEPVHLRAEEENWLDALISNVADNKRLQAIGTEEFWTRIDALWSRGRERLATEWIEKFVAAPTTPDEARSTLRLKLVDLLDRRGDSARAVPHLEALALIGEHATRAHYLLAEHYRRRGDEARALRHYEAVLARDVDYPNVRVRVERLRLASGRGAPAAMGETITGAGAVGVAEGARYHLLREIGRGATGVVYQARDFELERDVAIKLLHPHLAAARQALALGRFFDEARVAASLRHPNIVAILDLDEKARRLTMELCAGGTLRSVLAERGRLPLRRALERHAQILSALAAAHRRGVIHRDLKPGNLLFRTDPDAPGAEVVLADFGVAHLPDASGETGAAAAESKAPAEAVGTLAYMSPEQRQGAEADPRSDMFAAAVVLFEMLSGAPPWPRDVLLAGTRKRGDFRLGSDITEHIDPRLLPDLQAHVDRLGDPDASGRPNTEAALRESRRLRDFAIAVAVDTHPAK